MNKTRIQEALSARFYEFWKSIVGKIMVLTIHFSKAKVSFFDALVLLES